MSSQMLSPSEASSGPAGSPEPLDGDREPDHQEQGTPASSGLDHVAASTGPPRG